MENKKSNQIDIIILVAFFISGFIFLIVASHNNVEHRFSFLSCFLILYGVWGIYRKRIFFKNEFFNGIYAIFTSIFFIVFGVILVFLLKNF